MRDRQNGDDFSVVHIRCHENDGTGTALPTFLEAGQIFGSPKIGISNDQARAGSRKGHRSIFDFVVVSCAFGQRLGALDRGDILRSEIFQTHHPAIAPCQALVFGG